MSSTSEHVTRPLTLKYVMALALLAALAAINFAILSVAILDSQRMASIASTSNRQRMLLLRTAMLADRLVFSVDETERALVRHELTSQVEPLEQIHLHLMLPPTTSRVPPERVQAVYRSAPWLLDAEMKRYVENLRAVAATPDHELNYANPNFTYVRNPNTIDRILNGLDAVVSAYDQESAAKNAQLRMLAGWSLASTLALLLVSGWFVFRPMVKRVRAHMAALDDLNATLEARVAERTREAQRRAELLALSEAALRESEALYRSLVDHLPMCVMRKDRQGRFTFVNDAFCQLMRKPQAAILGHTDADFYPPEMVEKYRADDVRAMGDVRVLQDIEEHQTPEGRMLYVEVLKGPLRDSSGTIIGTQTVFWDVTDRKQAEQRAIQAERLAAIGQMVAGVAHESRNALQQIQACVQLLDWQLEAADSRRDLLADLQAAQDRLRRLFDELRGFAAPRRIEARLSSLHDVLHEAWSALEAERAGRDAELIELDAAPPIEADPFQLEQVFRNILENALAACPDPARIEVAYRELAHDDLEALAIAIRDNGPGLSGEQQQRIFEPFFTTKTRGTGLGMAIVKQIVEAHGGSIAVRNARPGAEFVITLPLRRRALMENGPAPQRAGA